MQRLYNHYLIGSINWTLEDIWQGILQAPRQVESLVTDLITLIAPGKPIVKVFEREDIKGKLLILGDPGSGKTTELLSLARDLANRAAELYSLIELLIVFGK